MAERITRQLVAEKAIVHAEVPVARAPHQVDRTFELPKGLYVATVGLFLGYLAVMAVGFRSPAMILPMAVFTISIVAGFGVPAIWGRLAPENASKPKTWGRFRNEGVQTGSGRASAGDASVQVLILPVLIFFWGVAVVTIAAIVR